MLSRSLLCLALGTAAISTAGAAAPPRGNTDEAKVLSYTLPDVLLATDGTRISDRDAWRTKRRPELLRLFSEHVYGRTPSLTPQLRYEVTATEPRALNGLATRKEITIRLFDDPAAPTISLLLFIPNAPADSSAAPRRAPVFLGLNYYGNQCVHPDPTITASTKWMRPSAEFGIVGNRATEKTRGSQETRWPLELAMRRGHAVATYYYGDLEPDHKDGWRDGLRGYLLKKEKRTDLRSDEWGALGVWAWGLSRCLDYIATDTALDAQRVAVFGHSRHGKTALWAGAQDERFAIVISNNSGEGGASLGRRNFGESIAQSIHSTGYWYCSNYAKYVDRAHDLPTDQHMLVALAAPRPVYVASASLDAHADPKGEYLAAFHAGPVYRLFGRRGLDTETLPAVNTPVGHDGHVGYHLREGAHSITAYDWERYLDFADRHYAARR